MPSTLLSMLACASMTAAVQLSVFTSLAISAIR
jgi:hypothetical protein